MMLDRYKFFAAAIAAAAAGSLPSQQQGAGTRFRGSRHPHQMPKGYRAKRKRLRQLQRHARKVQRESA
jgi:hypothetical protein